MAADDKAEPERKALSPCGPVDMKVSGAMSSFSSPTEPDVRALGDLDGVRAPSRTILSALVVRLSVRSWKFC